MIAAFCTSISPFSTKRCNKIMYERMEKNLQKTRDKKIYEETGEQQ